MSSKRAETQMMPIQIIGLIVVAMLILGSSYMFVRLAGTVKTTDSQVSAIYGNILDAMDTTNQAGVGSKCSFSGSLSSDLPLILPIKEGESNIYLNSGKLTLLDLETCTVGNCLCICEDLACKKSSCTITDKPIQFRFNIDGDTTDPSNALELLAALKGLNKYALENAPGAYELTQIAPTEQVPDCAVLEIQAVNNV